MDVPYCFGWGERHPGRKVIHNLGEGGKGKIPAPGEKESHRVQGF